MFNADVLKGRWQELRGKVKEKWGEITDDEFRVVDGKYDQFVGLIQRKTGETREAIEKHLSTIKWKHEAHAASGDSPLTKEDV
jgi:uncharacterized protein YjbJ (UPF0337 family)